MLRGIAWVLGVVLAVGCCWWLYTHAVGKEVPTNGDVFLRSAPSDSKDSQDSTAQSDSTGTPDKDATPQAAPPPATPAPQPAAPASASSTPQTPAPQVPSTAKPTAAIPVTDTLDANPPSGMAFGGSGRFQWYRQGNITYRIDTRSGSICVDFATMEEWSKPVVYSHGCRNA